MIVIALLDCQGLRLSGQHESRLLAALLYHDWRLLEVTGPVLLMLTHSQMVVLLRYKKVHRVVARCDTASSHKVLARGGVVEGTHCRSVQSIRQILWSRAIEALAMLLADMHQVVR